MHTRAARLGCTLLSSRGLLLLLIAASCAADDNIDELPWTRQSIARFGPNKEHELRCLVVIGANGSMKRTGCHTVMAGTAFQCQEISDALAEEILAKDAALANANATIAENEATIASFKALTTPPADCLALNMAALTWSNSNGDSSGAFENLYDGDPTTQLTVAQDASLQAGWIQLDLPHGTVCNLTAYRVSAQQIACYEGHAQSVCDGGNECFVWYHPPRAWEMQVQMQSRWVTVDSHREQDDANMCSRWGGNAWQRALSIPAVGSSFRLLITEGYNWGSFMVSELSLS